jgi:hypothetical protein
MNIGPDSHLLTGQAQNQVALRLGVPMTYLKKCPPGVQAYNLNHWIKEERNDKMFIRFNGPKIRALFTPRYQPVDNKEVIKKLESYGYDGDTEVQCTLDDEFMNLSIPDERRGFQLAGKDKMYPGISISNSEVGLASLSISAFILRLVCTNGLITKSDVSASYRHISDRILGDFNSILRQFSQDTDQMKQQWMISLESPVHDAQATLSSFNRQFNLRDNEIQAVEWAWNIEQGPHLFHVINSYTKAAQYPQLPAESVYRLQKTGGSILSLVR